jgi:ADP-ribose pyrophosphatase YjhB (NUDIX family)
VVDRSGTAPDIFYLPGGKPEAGEEPLATLERELGEELGVTLVSSKPFAVVSDRAALEHRPMEMHVFLATVAGEATPQAEIETVTWVGANGAIRGQARASDPQPRSSTTRGSASDHLINHRRRPKAAPDCPPSASDLGGVAILAPTDRSAVLDDELGKDNEPADRSYAGRDPLA